MKEFEDSTVTEWLEEKRLSHQDIDFITTCMAFFSTIKYSDKNSTQLLIRLKDNFPDYRIDIHKNYIHFIQVKELISNNFGQKLTL